MLLQIPRHWEKGVTRSTLDVFYNQSMFTKKQLSSLCKLYSLYEELAEEFLDETDVDSYFYHIILDISQSHHQRVRVGKGYNKKFFFCIQRISVLRFKVKAAIHSQGRSQHFQKRNWISTQQFGWVSQSFWSSQHSIADSITQS